MRQMVPGATRTREIGFPKRIVIPPGAKLNIFDGKTQEEGQCYRVAVSGPSDMRYSVEWGTSTTRKLVDLLGPIVADFPGGCSIDAFNDSVENALAVVTAAHTVAPAGSPLLRQFIDATAGPVQLQNGSARLLSVGTDTAYTLPDGTTYTILSAGQTSEGRPWPIHSGTIVTAGKCFVEYEI